MEERRTSEVVVTETSLPAREGSWTERRGSAFERSGFICCGVSGRSQLRGDGGGGGRGGWAKGGTSGPESLSETTARVRA